MTIYTKLCILFLLVLAICQHGIPQEEKCSKCIQDYMKKEIGQDLPFDIAAMIHETDPGQTHAEINPGVLVQFGDGKGYFGGFGSKPTNLSAGNRLEHIEKSLMRQMIWRRKNQ